MRHNPGSLFDRRRIPVDTRPDDNRVSRPMLNDTSISQHLRTSNHRRLVLKLKTRIWLIEGLPGISWVFSKPGQVVDVVIPDLRPS